MRDGRWNDWAGVVLQPCCGPRPSLDGRSRGHSHAHTELERSVSAEAREGISRHAVFCCGMLYEEDAEALHSNVPEILRMHFTHMPPLGVCMRREGGGGVLSGAKRWRLGDWGSGRIICPVRFFRLLA